MDKEGASQFRMLTAALDGVADAIVITDAETNGPDGPRVLYVNSSYARLLGYDAKDAVGRPLSLFRDGDAEGVARLRDCMDRWDECVTEVTTYRPDGSEICVTVTVRPISDGAGWHTHRVLTLRDVSEERRRQQEQQRDFDRYRTLIESDSIGIFRSDPGGEIIYRSERLQRDYPLPPTGKWADLVHPEDLDPVPPAKTWQDSIPTQSAYDRTYRLRNLDGAYHWRRVRALPLFNGDGKVYEWVGTVLDVSAEQERDVANRKNAEWLSYALEATEDGVYDWNFQTDQLTVSRRFTGLLGMTADAPVDATYYWVDFIHPDDFPEMLELARQLRSGYVQVIRQEIRMPRADGALHWFLHRGTVVERTQDGKSLRIVGTISDITERREMEQQLLDLLEGAVERADRDPLTGLYNHGAFHRHLEQYVHRANERDQKFGVAVLDVNHFKFFNDAYGHAVGDEVLKRISESLEEMRRPGDILGRIGGDEFAIIFPELPSDDRKELERRLECFSNVVGYRPPEYEYEIPLTLPFGIAFFPDDATNAHSLLEAADERLLRNKQDTAAGLTHSLRDKLLLRARDFALLDALVTAVDNKDRYTRRHSEDVLLYSLMISEELGMDAEQRATMMVAALVHDVGKIGVPDRILRRPGRLSEKDIIAMQQHVTLGAILVGAVKGLEDTVDAVRHHHERWDGRGYPDGLAEENIPFSARIMAVADAFSAMTTDRPYRRGMEYDRALAVLEAGASIQWDPVCVAALCRGMRTGVTNDGILKGARNTLDGLTGA